MALRVVRYYILQNFRALRPHVVGDAVLSVPLFKFQRSLLSELGAGDSAPYSSCFMVLAQPDGGKQSALTA